MSIGNLSVGRKQRISLKQTRKMSIVEIENISLRERLKDIKEAFKEVELLMGEVDGEIRIPKDEFENLKEAIYE